MRIVSTASTDFFQSPSTDAVRNGRGVSGLANTLNVEFNAGLEAQVAKVQAGPAWQNLLQTQRKLTQLQQQGAPAAARAEAHKALEHSVLRLQGDLEYARASVLVSVQRVRTIQAALSSASPDRANQERELQNALLVQNEAETRLSFLASSAAYEVLNRRHAPGGTAPLSDQEQAFRERMQAAQLRFNETDAAYQKALGEQTRDAVAYAEAGAGFGAGFDIMGWANSRNSKGQGNASAPPKEPGLDTLIKERERAENELKAHRNSLAEFKRSLPGAYVNAKADMLQTQSAWMQAKAQLSLSEARAGVLDAPNSDAAQAQLVQAQSEEAAALDFEQVRSQGGDAEEAQTQYQAFVKDPNAAGRAWSLEVATHFGTQPLPATDTSKLHASIRAALGLAEGAAPDAIDTQTVEAIAKQIQRQAKDKSLRAPHIVPTGYSYAIKPSEHGGGRGRSILFAVVEGDERDPVPEFFVDGLVGQGQSLADYHDDFTSFTEGNRLPGIDAALAIPKGGIFSPRATDEPLMDVIADGGHRAGAPEKFNLRHGTLVQGLTIGAAVVASVLAPIAPLLGKTAQTAGQASRASQIVQRSARATQGVAVGGMVYQTGLGLAQLKDDAERGRPINAQTVLISMNALATLASVYAIAAGVRAGQLQRAPNAGPAAGHTAMRHAVWGNRIGWTGFAVAAYDVQRLLTNNAGKGFAPGEREQVLIGIGMALAPIATAQSARWGAHRWQSNRVQAQQRVEDETQLRRDLALLGVSTASGHKAINDAYFALARRLHPDRNPDPKRHEQFKAVAQAYARYEAFLKRYGQWERMRANRTAPIQWVTQAASHPAQAPTLRQPSGPSRTILPALSSTAFSLQLGRLASTEAYTPAEPVLLPMRTPLAERRRRRAALRAAGMIKAPLPTHDRALAAFRARSAGPQAAGPGREIVRPFTVRSSMQPARLLPALAAGIHSASHVLSQSDHTPNSFDPTEPSTEIADTVSSSHAEQWSTVRNDAGGSSDEAAQQSHSPPVSGGHMEGHGGSVVRGPGPPPSGQPGSNTYFFPYLNTYYARSPHAPLDADPVAHIDPLQLDYLTASNTQRGLPESFLSLHDIAAMQGALSYWRARLKVLLTHLAPLEPRAANIELIWHRPSAQLQLPVIAVEAGPLQAAPHDNYHSIYSGPRTPITFPVMWRDGYGRARLEFAERTTDFHWPSSPGQGDKFLLGQALVLGHHSIQVNYGEVLHTRNAPGDALVEAALQDPQFKAALAQLREGLVRYTEETGSALRLATHPGISLRLARSPVRWKAVIDPNAVAPPTHPLQLTDAVELLLRFKAYRDRHGASALKDFQATDSEAHQFHDVARYLIYLNVLQLRARIGRPFGLAHIHPELKKLPSDDPLVIQMLEWLQGRNLRMRQRGLDAEAWMREPSQEPGSPEPTPSRWQPYSLATWKPLTSTHAGQPPSGRLFRSKVNGLGYAFRQTSNDAEPIVVEVDGYPAQQLQIQLHRSDEGMNGTATVQVLTADVRAPALGPEEILALASSVLQRSGHWKHLRHLRFVNASTTGIPVAPPDIDLRAVAQQLAGTKTQLQPGAEVRFPEGYVADALAVNKPQTRGVEATLVSVGDAINRCPMQAAEAKAQLAAAAADETAPPRQRMQAGRKLRSSDFVSPAYRATMLAIRDIEAMFAAGEIPPAWAPERVAHHRQASVDRSGDMRQNRYLPDEILLARVLKEWIEPYGPMAIDTYPPNQRAVLYEQFGESTYTQRAAVMNFLKEAAPDLPLDAPQTLQHAIWTPEFAHLSLEVRRAVQALGLGTDLAASLTGGLMFNMDLSSITHADALAALHAAGAPPDRMAFEAIDALAELALPASLTDEFFTPHFKLNRGSPSRVNPFTAHHDSATGRWLLRLYSPDFPKNLHMHPPSVCAGTKTLLVTDEDRPHLHAFLDRLVAMGYSLPPHLYAGINAAQLEFILTVLTAEHLRQTTGMRLYAQPRLRRHANGVTVTTATSDGNIVLEAVRSEPTQSIRLTVDDLRALPHEEQAILLALALRDLPELDQATVRVIGQDPSDLHARMLEAYRQLSIEARPTTIQTR